MEPVVASCNSVVKVNIQDSCSTPMGPTLLCKHLPKHRIYHNKKFIFLGAERPNPADPGNPSIKLSNQEGHIPDELYHATSLGAALGAIVTGHLVASNTSHPQAVYFSPSLAKITSYDAGAIFTAKIYGLYPGKKDSAEFFHSVVPMGIVLHNNRCAADWMCDTFSHKLLSVTIKTEMLKGFLGEWVAAGRPVLSLPVPPMVTTPSYQLLGGLEPMSKPILDELATRYARLVKRRRAYVEAKRRLARSLLSSEGSGSGSTDITAEMRLPVNTSWHVATGVAADSASALSPSGIEGASSASSARKRTREDGHE